MADKLDMDEKKRIQQMMKEKGGANMDWMYKTDKTNPEEYLLGKRVDRHVEGETDTRKEEDIALFNDRITANIQLDMQAKMREDPLFAIKKKEIEAKKKLLDNPVKMKQLQKMLAHQKKEKRKKDKKKKKKHRKNRSDSDSDEDGDDLVKQYLTLLSKKQSKDGASSKHKHSKEDGHHKRRHGNEDHSRTRGHSHDRAEQSSHADRHHSSRHEVRHSRHRSHSSSSDDSDQEETDGKRHYGLEVPKSHSTSHREHSTSPIKHSSKKSKSSRRSKSPKNRYRQESPSLSHNAHRSSKRPRSRSPRPRERSPDPRQQSRKRPSPKRKLTEEERQKKLEEMMANARWRDEQRRKNVEKYDKETKQEEDSQIQHGAKADFLTSMMSEHAAKSSVEDRLRRNKYNIQRTNAALSKNFTKQ